MLKFKSNRTFDEVIAFANEEGWEIDREKFDNEGSDWICLRDMYGNVESNDGIPRQVVFNVTNGHFFVYEPLRDDPVASHRSYSLDNEDWYKALLYMFYEPLEVIGESKMTNVKTLISFVCDADERNKVERRLLSVGVMVECYEANQKSQDSQR